MASTYPDPQSNSARLYERASKVLAGGSTRLTTWFAPYPIYAVSGKGSRVTDADGVERVDCLNNYMTLIHGHAHPDVVAAIEHPETSNLCFRSDRVHDPGDGGAVTIDVKSLTGIRGTGHGSV